MSVDGPRRARCTRWCATTYRHSTLWLRMGLRHRCPRSCATSSSAIWNVESYVEVSPGFSATPVTSSGSWRSAAKVGPFVHVVWADAWPRAPRISWHVLPMVPLRQFVITFPFELRARLAYDGKLLGAATRPLLVRPMRGKDRQVMQCPYLVKVNCWTCINNGSTHFSSAQTRSSFTAAVCRPRR